MQKDKKLQHNFKVTINQKLLTSSYPVQNTSQAYFPYQPYPEQSQVIQTIHQSVISSQNALIQSPTGTGKTLCLLVGSLSALKVLRLRNVKIFYLTRTHSQISQVIQEVRETCYQAKVNIIASRDHLCVNPNTKEMKGRILEKGCNDMVNNKTCIFKQTDKNPHIKLEPIALEDFKDQCRKQLVCPFFYTRDLTQKTQITILPFNYFLDWRIFQTFAHLIKDSVIIFDQAHNVDSVAQQGGNLDIDCRQVSFAVNELKQLQRKFKFESQSNLKNKIQVKTAYIVLQRLKNSIQQCKYKVFCSKSQLQEFMQNSTKITDPQNNSQIIDGLDFSDTVPFFQNFHQVTKLFYKKQVNPSNYTNLIVNLQKLCTLYKAQRFDKDFIVKITSDEQGKYFALRLKCLSPSIGFQKIKSHQPRSIILSSGTLGKLDNWQRYLNIQFKQKLSISSFITKNQLFASIIPKSQRDYTFQFSYQKKDYDNQHRQVAQELKIIENVIPDGNGIVVAFSTYLLMEKVIKHCNILRKKVFYESKGSDVNRTFNQYATQAKQQGAFLFIVMKGRFSEGINFSDYLCRCLIVVGIPFLPRKQSNVDEKMQYLDQNYSSGDAQAWYMQQTFQAVNQTIGRVIRNKKDYGVILLLDQRYSKKDNFQLLSQWFKKCSRKSDINMLYNQIKDFFTKQSWINNVEIDLKTVKTSEMPSVKTIIKVNNKKRHLNLRYDSEQKIKSSSRKNVSQDSNKTISSIYKTNIKNNLNQSNKKSKQKLSEKSQIFKTPRRSHKKMIKSSSIVLSKINIEKKHKLKGFVNDKLDNAKKTNLLQQLMKIDEMNETKEENNKGQQIKTQPKKVSKRIQNNKKSQINPFLEFFMI